MPLLNGFTLGQEFEIETELMQACTEDPNNILEQLVFSSELDFGPCCEQLENALSLRYGPSAAPALSIQGEISVACYTFAKEATRVTAQISCEGPGYCCHGFIHASTRWLSDAHD
ncbi:hypothetical protein [Stenotrophomonas pigmentata]|uniref:hypothetical protein n=1 Tax=Stenotrophomonas pigmentata TaxID=3055080 RepID=UPI0026F2508D|nr:hypothetical protein [Stenotrophomonas sp. 610A2]